MGDHLMTQMGHDQIEARLKHYKNVDLPKAQQALGEAREKGDLSENAEYDAAREELWLLEERIREATERLAGAQVIRAADIDRNSVCFGAQVVVRKKPSGEKESFWLIGEGEGDLAKDAIAFTSPIGQALMGKQPGDTAVVEAPEGKVKYEVVSISYDRMDGAK